MIAQERATSETRGVICSLDTSESSPVFLLESAAGAKIRISTVAKTVLELRWSGRTFADISLILEHSLQRAASPEEVSSYYDGLMSKIDSYDRQAAIAIDAGFAFRLPLFPERVVRLWSSRLTWAFDRRLAFLTTIIALLSYGFWFRTWQSRGAVSAADIVFGYFLFMVSVIAHEFGHASACKRFGVEPGKIGFTIYLVFPALYSDVTTAWSLPRLQRVAVDLGGMYLQSVVGVLFIAIDAATGIHAFHYATILVVLTALFNLNPVFKFDGYWMLADLLGVTNLAAQPRRLLAYAMAKLRGCRVDPLPWNAWVIALLAAYAVIAVIVWGVFVVRLLIGLALGVVHMRPLLEGVQHSNFEHGHVTAALFTILGMAVALYAIVRRGRFWTRGLLARVIAANGFRYARASASARSRTGSRPATRSSNVVPTNSSG